MNGPANSNTHIYLCNPGNSQDTEQIRDLQNSYVLPLCSYIVLEALSLATTALVSITFVKEGQIGQGFCFFLFLYMNVLS